MYFKVHKATVSVKNYVTSKMIFQDHPREEKLLAASIVSLHSSFSFCGKMYHAQVTLVRFFPLMKHVLVYDSFVTFGIQYSACTDASLGQLTALFLFMQT